MNTLRTIGYAICVTLVVTSIFMMLLPSSHMTKIVKFAVYLFLLIAIITPFLDHPIDFSRSMNPYLEGENETAKSLNELADQQLILSFERSLKAQVEAILKKQGIQAKKIHFSINISSDRSIDISKLEIVLKGTDKEKSEKAIKAVNESFGLTAEIHFFDEPE